MNTKLPLSIGFCIVATAALAQPTIISQPTDQTANQGYSATFQLRATGTPPLSYAWFFNQLTIAGATTNKLTITNAQPTTDGDYFAVISDSTGSVTSRVANLTVTTSIRLDPKIGQTILMGPDPEKLPANGRLEFEPHLIRSIEQPNTLVGVYSDGRNADASLGLATGYSISSDGGLTWQRALVENFSPITGGTLGRPGDPSVAIDLKGNIYLSAFDVFNPTYCAISKMSKAGTEFAAPTKFNLRSGYDIDKPWTVVNTYSNTPTAGRVFLTWSLGAAGSGLFDQGIEAVYSDDAGTNWTGPFLISKKQAYGTQPLFLPDGSLTMLFENGSYVIQMITSPDGGQTYGTNRVVTSFTKYHEPLARNVDFFISATTDRQAGIIYVAFQTLDGRGTNARPAIQFTRSIDRGQTWNKPMAVNDTPAKHSVFTPVIAASPDGQHVMVEFYDKRNDTGQGYMVDLYLAESFDGGDTWEPNVRVTEFSSDIRKAPLFSTTETGYGLGDYLGLVPALGLRENAPAVACWIDTRSGSSDPYSARIQRTRGATFETWRKLRWGTNDLASASISGPAADPDGDGIPNFAEYALGLEPNHVDSSPIQTARYDSNTLLSLSFTHPNVLEDVEFGWEESSDLVHWEKTGLYPKRAAPTSDDLTGFWRKEPWIYKVDPGINKFIRLMVQQRAP